MMSYDFESLLESGKPSDVVLVVGKKELRVHKHVLSARSPVFDAMFAHSSTKESQENRVEITDVDVEVLKLLVRYIYTGKFEMLDFGDYAAELLVAADKYQVEYLKSICEDHLLSKITIKTFSYLMIFSDLYSVTELFTECVHFIINNSKRAFASNGWKKIVVRADLMSKLCELLNSKYSELKFCEQQVLSSITAESVSDLLIHAEMHQVTELMSKCIDYIAENGTRVMATDGWKKIAIRADLLTKIFEHLIVKYNQVFDE